MKRVQANTLFGNVKSETKKKKEKEKEKNANAGETPQLLAVFLLLLVPFSRVLFPFLFLLVMKMNKQFRAASSKMLPCHVMEGERSKKQKARSKKHQLRNARHQSSPKMCNRARLFFHSVRLNCRYPILPVSYSTRDMALNSLKFSFSKSKESKPLGVGTNGIS